MGLIHIGSKWSLEFSILQDLTKTKGRKNSHRVEDIKILRGKAGFSDESRHV